MIYIISGTNRVQSKTFEVAQIVRGFYTGINVETEIINLIDLDLNEGAGNYHLIRPPKVVDAIEKLNKADGIHFVIPEYNGSMPGILKYFIDFFDYPATFESRPIAFVGLGGRWGGLRAVEHLQGVFGYRNGFLFPQRVFINNVTKVVVDGIIKDDLINGLIKNQVIGFHKFIRALKSEKLDANSVAKITCF